MNGRVVVEAELIVLDHKETFEVTPELKAVLLQSLKPTAARRSQPRSSFARCAVANDTSRITPMWFTFSRRSALVLGVLLPVAETIRRWGTWWEYPPNYLDDVSIGAFLLFAGWYSGRKPLAGQRYLAAAWGYACGMGYMSFFGHLSKLQATDPAPIPHPALAAIIGCGWLFVIVAMFAALRPLPDSYRTSLAIRLR